MTIPYQPSLFEDASSPCVDRSELNQGQRAVRNGQMAEKTIYCMIREAGYRVSRQQKIGKSFSGGNLIVDFFIHDHPAFSEGLIIESKWQETSGSVDEKLVLLREHIMRRFPCPAIVVYGGGAARSGFIEYLKNSVDGKKLYAVFSWEEFLSWAMRNL